MEQRRRGPFLVIEVANPEHPEIVAEAPTRGGTCTVTVSGTRACVRSCDPPSVDGRHLTSIDTSSPESPQILGVASTTSYDTEGTWDVAVVDSYAYIADHEFGLQVIDVSGSQSVPVLGQIDTVFPARVAVSGTYAYTTDDLGSHLTVIDISSPETPQAVGSVESGPAEDLAVWGAYACVLDFSAASTC